MVCDKIESVQQKMCNANYFMPVTEENLQNKDTKMDIRIKS
jgi:hypothetical protein